MVVVMPCSVGGAFSITIIFIQRVHSCGDNDNDVMHVCCLVEIGSDGGDAGLRLSGFLMLLIIVLLLLPATLTRRTYSEYLRISKGAGYRQVQWRRVKLLKPKTHKVVGSNFQWIQSKQKRPNITTVLTPTQWADE